MSSPETDENYFTPIKEQIEENKRKLEIRKMAQDLETLILQRGAVKGKVTRIKTTLDSAAADAKFSKQQLELYKKLLDSSLTEYNSFQNKIYGLITPDKKDEQEQKYIQFEELYFEVYVNVNMKLDELLEEQNGNKNIIKHNKHNKNIIINENAGNGAVGIPGNIIIRHGKGGLPNTPLPEFDGSPEKYRKFRSIFQDIINKCKHESDATKFTILKKCWSAKQKVQLISKR